VAITIIITIGARRGVAETLLAVRSAAVDLASLPRDWNLIPLCRTLARRR
jgi:hypothetical protein